MEVKTRIKIKHCAKCNKSEKEEKLSKPYHIPFTGKIRIVRFCQVDEKAYLDLCKELAAERQRRLEEFFGNDVDFT